MSSSSYSLFELLRAMGTGRIALDWKKRQLCEMPGFSQSAVFTLFDQEGKGHLALADLYNFLKSRYINPTESELFTLFKDIDRNKSGRITVSELIDFLMPQNSRVGAAKSLGGDINSALTEIFDQVIENYRVSDHKKSILLSNAEPKEVFSLLDANRNGAVTSLEVRSFMLSHGCHDQELISSTLLELHRILGSSFTVRDLEMYLQPAEVSQRSQNFEGRGNNGGNAYFSPVDRLTTKKSESSSVFAGKIGDYDQVFEAKSYENEERRNYLKEQEKIRNKLMEDVMSRKKAYLNIRLDGEAPPPIGAIKREEQAQYSKKLESKYSELQRGQSANRVKWIGDSIPQTRVGSPSSYKANAMKSEVSKDDLVKKAASEAQFRIEQIQQQARFKAQDFRRREQQVRKTEQTNFQDLLLRKNSELQIEKQRRLTLQKQLSRSRLQIEQLKNHLQQIDQLNYREIELNKLGKPSGYGGDFYEPVGAPRHRSRDVLGAANRSLEGIDESYSKGYVNRSEQGFSKDVQENKYQLEQALRRSRIEREFAKFKLEKELARSRVAWR